MMELKILYFSQIRESVGCAEEDCTVPDEVNNMGALRRYLAARGEAWALLLDRRTVQVARNRVLAKDSVALESGDEVAFFPPVTGG